MTIFLGSGVIMGYWTSAPEPPRRTNAARDCIAHGECRPRARSTKPTAKWCRGRVGVPHAYSWWPDPVRQYGGCVYTPHGAVVVTQANRWRREIRICLACDRHGYGWRTHCRACGSPRRYLYERDARGYRTLRVNGPFCLCVDNFDPEARPGELWSTRSDPPIPWADDPDQIRALTAAWEAAR